jgi:heptosyltransferase I
MYRRTAGRLHTTTERLQRMPEAPRSIAIVLLSAIGDVVHGMPVATSLKAAWPEARVTWIIQPLAHGLVEPHPDVDEFIVFDRSAGIKAFRDFRHATAGRSFDLVVALQVYLKAGLLTGMIRSPRKLGFDRRRARDFNWLFTTERIPPHAPQHVQDQYFEFLDHLGVAPVQEWKFGFTEAERRSQEEFFAELDRPALAVVVGTTRPGKNWIPERYARVLEVAEADLGLKPVIVGSENALEMDAAREIMEMSRAAPVLALRNDVRRLAWLLDGSALMLSPDTGPLHVATALGTPVVSLYGYTDPKRVGPYRGSRDLIIDRFSRPGETLPTAGFRKGNMRRIEVTDVLEKLEQAVRDIRPAE